MLNYLNTQTLFSHILIFCHLAAAILNRKRNMIQDLNGNARVVVRILPPFLDKDGDSYYNDNVSLKDDRTVIVMNPKSTRQPHEFSFDRVFSPTAGQDVVFEEVSELVRSALDGYNVCIFSYGQTGSG